MTCRVVDCGKTRDTENNPGIRFFKSSPADKTIQLAWIKACGLHSLPSKGFLVCSDHFAKDDYDWQEGISLKSLGKWRLKKDAVPTLNLPLADKTVPGYKRKNKETKVFVSTTSQTDSSCGDSETILAISKEQSSHRHQMNVRKKRLQDLQDRFDAEVEETEKIYKLFTPNQLLRLQTGKQPTWTHEDVAAAMAIYTTGPKVYKILCDKGFPYPAPATLRRLARKFNIKAGALI